MHASLYEKITYLCLNKWCKLQGALANVFTKVPLNINGLTNALQRLTELQ